MKIKPLSAACLLVTGMVAGTANAAMLGLDLENPTIRYNNTGTAVYDAGTGLLKINADPLFFLNDSLAIVNQAKSLEIQFKVNSDGTLNSGVTGDDLVITGEIDADSDGTVDYSGVLLTAEVSKFGFAVPKPGQTTNSFEAGFTITGGSLAPLYVGKDLGLFLATESNGSAVPFTGDFSLDWNGGAKGNVGAIDQEGMPCTGSIGDYVWFDYNENGVQDSDEQGIGDVLVTLKDSSGTTIASTPTASSGMYIFTELCAGDYTVTVDPSTLPPGFNVKTYDLDGVATPDTTAVTLTENDEAVLNADFGYKGNGSIGDTVWLDTNGNGIQEAGEDGLSGVTVTLEADIDGDGVKEFVREMTTDSDGFYLFGMLPAGDFKITVDPTTLPDGVDENTFDVDGNKDGMATVNLTPGEDDTTVDFGYKGSGALGDTVWLDLDADKTQDADEPGISGVTVKLEADTNGDGVVDFTDTAVTDASGRYMFNSLPAGTYKVTVDANTLPAGLDQTFDLDGTLDDMAEAALPAGGSRLDVDFGYTGLGSLGDFVWLDLNNNGNQDASEPGLEGIRVVLTGDINNDGVIDFTQTDETDGNGIYGFGNLPAGQYTVTVDDATLPTGLSQTFDLDGTLDDKTTVDLASGQNDPRLDFGYTGEGMIGDLIWRDNNANGTKEDGEDGISGVKVTLMGDLDGDGTFDFSIDTVTGPTGTYSFPNLPQGSYKVTVDPATLPADINPTFDLDGIDTPNKALLDLGSQETNLTADFGYRHLGRIGDLVWLDEDGDGIKDPDENGISGVNVTLMIDANSDGSYESSIDTTTDGSGIYDFPNLAKGTYKVTIDPSTLPANVNQTFDLDGLGTPNQAILNLGTDQTNLDVDFGYQESTGSIGDTVWIDSNGNGDQDDGEEGIPGVKVTLMGDTDGDDNFDINIDTTTDASGLYSFDNLAAGFYKVTIDPATLPDDVVQTYDLDGIDTPDKAELDLAPNENNEDVDFGYRKETGKIGDQVWLDTNDNGVKDDGEEGIAGVTVNLMGDVDGDGTFEINVDTTTDASGLYSFDDLQAGSYKVTVDPDGLPDDVEPTHDLDGTDTPNVALLTLGVAETKLDVDFGYNTVDCVPEDISWVDFEGLTSKKWAILNNAPGLIGWSTDNPNQHIEVGQERNYGGKSSKNYVIELEANDWDPSNLYLDIDTKPGQIYKFELDYSGRKGFKPSGIKVIWDGKVVDKLTSNGKFRWSHHTYYLEGTGDTVRLELKAMDKNGYGGVLDNLDVSAVCDEDPVDPPTDPEPPLACNATDAHRDHYNVWGGGGYAFIYNGYPFLIENGRFEESDDGSAMLTGTLKYAQNHSNKYKMEIKFSGKTDDVNNPFTNGLKSSAYSQNGGPVDVDTWQYYKKFSGKLTGFDRSKGNVLELFSKKGMSVQVGDGATQWNVDFGLGHWITYKKYYWGKKVHYGKGDLNVNLQCD